MYDIIGDIHGFAAPLKNLLIKMGYEKHGKGYRHPERKALFLGDYIDRGEEILETLEIVRSMHENDDAIALMGNHEYNAICYNLPDGKGDFLRPRLKRNVDQHEKTLLAFKDKDEEYKDYLEWFKSLSLYFENESFRAVHACWDDKMIDVLKAESVIDKISDHFIYRSADKSNYLFKALDQTLKGVEIKLPKDFQYYDKENNVLRKEIRVKWWENPRGFNYKTYAVTPDEISFPETEIDLADCNFTIYSEKSKPVFFGHYWLSGKPQLLCPNVCCLDYSIANNGLLVAYRYNGENILNPLNFIYENA